MSLCSTSSWSSAKPGIAPRNDRHLATLLYNSSPAKFQAQYDTAAPGAAPGAAVSRFEGYVDLLYNNYAGTMSWFSAAILEFLRLIIQHHGVWNHGRISSLNPHYICQNNCSWFKEKKLSQFCIPSNKLTGNHTQIHGFTIHVVCWGFCPSRDDVCTAPHSYGLFGRISRGVPRVAFSFTITLYLVRMKKK